MESANLRIGDLLAGNVTVLHTKWRFSLQKRIVEYRDERYVLYRFRWKSSMARFERAIRRLHQAGIPVQSVRARTSSLAEYLRYGNCVALSYLPGKPIAGRKNRPALASLGRVLASLNSLKGPPRRSLFKLERPVLPHRAFLDRQETLDDSQRSWLRRSMARLSGLPATQLTHGDLFGANIIQNDDNSVGLIDYELMAYDLAGIELAATFLRPFSRSQAQRRVLLDAYLASCPPELCEAWARFDRDFVFAAAARLAMARQDRILHVSRRNKALLAVKLISFGRKRLALEARLAANRKIVAQSERNGSYYLSVARTMIDLCAANLNADAISLLEECDSRYRAEQASLTAPSESGG